MTVAHPAILTSDPPRLDQVVLAGVGDCPHGEDCGDGVHRGVPDQCRTTGSAAVMTGALLALVPWFAFYLRLDRRGRSKALQRDRVVVVGRPDEISDFEFKEAERPVVLVDCMSPEQVDASSAREHLDAEVRPHIPRARSRGTISPDCGRSSCRFHVEGLGVRTVSRFYEQWSGKLSIGVRERMFLLFDIGEAQRCRCVRQRRVVDLTLGVSARDVEIVAEPFGSSVTAS